MPTRRQLLVAGGAGTSVAGVAGLWWIFGGDDPDAGAATIHADDGSNDDAKTDPDPPFEVSYAVDRSDRVSIDDRITVTAHVENVGKTAGTHDHRIVVRHDDHPDDGTASTGSASLNPGESTAVDHEFGFQRTGPHTVKADKDVIDTFRVRRPSGGSGGGGGGGGLPPGSPDDPSVGPGVSGDLDGE